MGRKKIEMKYIEDNITRQVTFAKRRAGIFKKAEALARLCNIDVGVFINSPSGQSYTYGSPSFNDAAKHILNPYSTRGRFSPSPVQSRILKNQVKLDHLTEELKHSKEREKVLKKTHEENLANYNMEKNIDLKLEDFVAFKEKLEVVRDNINLKHEEMEASSSLLMLSKSKNENMSKRKSRKNKKI